MIGLKFGPRGVPSITLTHMGFYTMVNQNAFGICESGLVFFKRERNIVLIETVRICSRTRKKMAKILATKSWVKKIVL